MLSSRSTPLRSEAAGHPGVEVVCEARAVDADGDYGNLPGSLEHCATEELRRGSRGRAAGAIDGRYGPGRRGLLVKPGGLLRDRHVALHQCHPSICTPGELRAWRMAIPSSGSEPTVPVARSVSMISRMRQELHTRG